MIVELFTILELLSDSSGPDEFVEIEFAEIELNELDGSESDEIEADGLGERFEEEDELPKPFEEEFRFVDAEASTCQKWGRATDEEEDEEEDEKKNFGSWVALIWLVELNC